jgi:hypothetical protein
MCRGISASFAESDGCLSLAGGSASLGSRSNFRNDDGATLTYIAVAHIVAIKPFENWTAIEVTTGWNYTVKETTEQILAMPEMVYAMCPAMVVNQQPLNPSLIAGDYRLR